MLGIGQLAGPTLAGIAADAVGLRGAFPGAAAVVALNAALRPGRTGATVFATSR
jgi:hypothetical protein